MAWREENKVLISEIILRKKKKLTFSFEDEKKRLDKLCIYSVFSWLISFCWLVVSSWNIYSSAKIKEQKYNIWVVPALKEKMS